ncbi:PAS domain S-box protein [Nostoc sp. FACHB-87]|uniref:PAS domain S-box protein n=1 Tax=Nostocaceae TaxID=1162 RepID=UPI0016838CD9|nr:MULTISPECIES: PAS domain S-box protein [Nostocaceae]MBD2299145.1 PAS domain S-box protein [Nostoc sp. FACHB-190]MBD2454559.1 PAS domain S-box protein [Nostoc sp. FACHB-87]MBD2476396.1 PAS domain S-box protein [Anabaena sp. FACHB-83]
MNSQIQNIQPNNVKNCSVNSHTACPEIAFPSPEQQLQQLQNKLLLLTQYNPLPIIEWNAAFEVTEWNLAAEKLFGYSKHEVLGCNVIELLVPENSRTEVSMIMQSFLQQLEAKNNVNLNENIDKNQKIIVCEWSNIPVFDLNGQIISIISIVKDFTEVNNSIKAIRENEKKYQSILDAITDMVLVKGANSRIIWANKAFRDYYGMSASELKDLIDAPFNEADNTLQYIKDDAYVFETGNTLEIPEEKVTRYNGEVRLFHTIKSAIRNEKGEIVMTVGVSRDESDRQQVEKEKAKLLAILEAAPDFISTADLTGQVLYFNQAARRMLGLSETESFQGRNLSQNHPQWTNEIILNQGIPESIRCGNWVGETALLGADGKEIPLSQLIIAHKSPDGQVEYLSTVARDISELKAVEECLRQKAQDLEKTLKELQYTQAHLIQSEKMSSIGQLVAGVAHEINNPTSFIYSNIQPATEYIQNLLDLIGLYQQHYPHPEKVIQDHINAIDLEFLIADLPRLLSSMKIGAERISQIVLSLRNFSRMDEAECKAVDIHSGIDSTLVILTHRLKAQHNRPAIAVIKEYGNLPLVECYPGHLNQVFMNILVNALDALEERDQKRSLAQIQENPSSIRIQTFVSNTKHIIIRFIDNGPGIPENLLKRLFDPFFTTKPVGVGTGLGLSISYQIIVNKHKGKLTCLSTPEQGAEFQIEIPIHLGLS